MCIKIQKMSALCNHHQQERQNLYRLFKALFTSEPETHSLQNLIPESWHRLVSQLAPPIDTGLNTINLLINLNMELK